MLIKLFLIVLALQVTIIKQSTCSGSPEQVYELLTKKGDLESHEVLTLLDELRELNYPFNADDLKSLLDLQKESPTKCSLSYYVGCDNLEKKYAKYSQTIVPLIKKLRFARFSECGKTYEEKVEKALSEMDDNVKYKVNQLCDINDGKYRDLYQDQVLRLVKYMRNDERFHEPRILKNSEEFLRLFCETVDGVCMPYMNDLYEELSIYDLMFPSEDPNKKLSVDQLAKILVDNVPNGNVLLWIIKARLCFMINDEVELFSDEVRKILKKEFNVNPLQSFFGKFGGKKRT